MRETERLYGKESVRLRKFETNTAKLKLRDRVSERKTERLCGTGRQI